MYEARGHGEEHKGEQLDARVEALEQTRARGQFLVLQHLSNGVGDGIRRLAGERTPAPAAVTGSRRRLRRLRLAAPGEQCPDGEGDGHREPVSYTHLRAHETRHDLVCRLLL